MYARIAYSVCINGCIQRLHIGIYAHTDLCTHVSREMCMNACVYNQLYGCMHEWYVRVAEEEFLQQK